MLITNIRLKVRFHCFFFSLHLLQFWGFKLILRLWNGNRKSNPNSGLTLFSLLLLSIPLAPQDFRMVKNQLIDSSVLLGPSQPTVQSRVLKMTADPLYRGSLGSEVGLEPSWALEVERMRRWERRESFRSPELLFSGLNDFLFFTWQLSDPLKILPGKRLCAILVNSVSSRELKCEFKFCLTSCVALRWLS